MSRNVTLVLLGAAALCSCCCLIPRPRQDEEQQYDENGDPIPPGGGSYHRRSFWFPMFFSGPSYRSEYSAPYHPSSVRPGSTPGKGSGVPRGGFGGTGHSMTSGGS